MHKWSNEELKKLGHVYENMDRDHDGSVSITEFIKAVRQDPEADKLLKLPKEARLADIEDEFQAADKDHNKQLSLEEFVDFCSRLRKRFDLQESLKADQSSKKNTKTRAALPSGPPTSVTPTSSNKKRNKKLKKKAAGETQAEEETFEIEGTEVQVEVDSQPVSASSAPQESEGEVQQTETFAALSIPPVKLEAKKRKSAPAIKLTYFDIKGRAEPVRLAFAIGDVEFEDDRIQRPQWLELKPTTPFGQLPMLTVGGKQVAQSAAILRYAGKLSGLYPHDPLEALLVDEMLDAFEDLAQKLGPSMAEQDEAKKLAMRKQLAETTFPELLGKIDARIAQESQKHGCAVGNKTSIADLRIYGTVGYLKSGMLDGFPTDIVDPYQNIIAVFKHVGQIPQVLAWNAQHDQPTLKLTYFNSPGRAEPVRLAFKIGGIAFEDVRVQGDGWLKLKPTTPWGQVPILEVDGEVLAQSAAILRYAGKLSGLYPNDHTAAFHVDELLDSLADLIGLLLPSFAEKDEEKRLAMRKALVEGPFPKLLANIDAKLGRSGTNGYSVGNELTIADLSVYTNIAGLKSGYLDGFPTDIADSYKNLTAVYNTVKAHPVVAAWNEEQQKKKQETSA
eukprot:m.9376 g.9376  ORF g.9376 m.9376 type:complete len:618 (-) comp7187_c0_seq1:46-1899(-)